MELAVSGRAITGGHGSPRDRRDTHYGIVETMVAARMKARRMSVTAVFDPRHLRHLRIKRQEQELRDSGRRPSPLRTGNGGDEPHVGEHDTEDVPNSAASKFLVKLPMTEMIAIPIAKLAEVTTPIAASAPIVFRRATFWISSADTRPHASAPT